MRYRGQSLAVMGVLIYNADRVRFYFIGLVEDDFKTSRNKEFFVDKDMSIKRTLCRCAHPILWQEKFQPVKFRGFEQ